MLDLTDLHYFATVAREGGVTRAAEKLFRVQSNVSSRIGKLERQLGVDLFLREGRKMILTGDGHRMLSYAERLIALADEAERAITQSVPGGPFRLGAMESTAAVRLPSVLDRLTGAHPDIELELVTGNPVDLAERVIGGNIEAAFAALRPSDPRLDSVPAFDETVVVVSAARELDPDTPLLVLERGCPHRAQFEAFYASQGRPLGRQIEIGSYHAMFGCVLARMGAALVPESVIATFPNSDRLVRHALPAPWSRLSTNLIWRRDVMSGNLRALVAALSTG